MLARTPRGLDSSSQTPDEKIEALLGLSAPTDKTNPPLGEPRGGNVRCPRPVTDVGKDAVGAIERLARIGRVHQHVASGPHVFSSRRQRPAIEAGKRVEQIAQALGPEKSDRKDDQPVVRRSAGAAPGSNKRTASARTSTGWGFGRIGSCARRPRRSRPRRSARRSGVAACAAATGQAADALVEPAKGRGGPGAAAGREKRRAGAVGSQVAEIVLGDGEGIDIDVVLRRQAPGHLVEGALAAARRQVVVDGDTHYGSRSRGGSHGGHTGNDRHRWNGMSDNRTRCNDCTMSDIHAV